MQVLLNLEVEPVHPLLAAGVLLTRESQYHHPLLSIGSLRTGFVQFTIYCDVLKITICTSDEYDSTQRLFDYNYCMHLCCLGEFLHISLAKKTLVCFHGGNLMKECWTLDSHAFKVTESLD